MSIEVKIDALSDHERTAIANLKVRIKRRYATDVIYPYAVMEDSVILPLAYAVKHAHTTADASYRPICGKARTSITLSDEQKEIVRDIITNLNARRSVVVSCYVGIGKTIMSIYMLKRVKLRTLVVVNSNAILQQWVEECDKVYDGNIRAQALKSRVAVDETCDLFVIHGTNVAKVQFPPNFIGLVIVDELHLILAEGLHKCLQHLFPKYLIGLSATPYRYDGCDALIDLYFGAERIVRTLHCPHVAYRVSTHIRPRVEKTASGEVNWSVVIKSLSEHTGRNELIVRIVRHFSDRNFLLLCKLLSQVRTLMTMLEGESVDYFCDTKTSFNKDVRVLIGTLKKCGTGFNFPKLNALVLCADVENYAVQIFGRVMRRKTAQKPLIFDLVDTNVSLERHYETRRAVYQEVGGEVVDLRRVHPELFTTNL